MSESTFDPWILPESTPASREAAHRIRWRFRTILAARPARRVQRTLLAGLVAGGVLGSALTALATLPKTAAVEEAPRPVATRQVPKQALDREWRGYRTPVDVDRMFRNRR